MTTVLPTSDAPRVSILIVTARHGEHLRACLRALARQVPAALRWEVIVLLNRADPDVESAAGEFAGIRVETSAVDLGLAGGLNRLRPLARGEFLVILHDDTEVEPGWLEGLLDAAGAHPEAGAVGSWVLNMDGTDQHFGGVLWADGLSELNHPRQPSDGRELLAVDSTGSSSMLVRAAVWDAVGGPSEEFFPAFYVDLDLALKIWESGAAVLVTQASRLRHIRSASTERVFRDFLFLRNHPLFTAKWPRALAEREPRGELPAALSRGLERAAARWRAARPTPPPAAAPLLDRDAQERRHLQLSADLQRDWAVVLWHRELAARADLAEMQGLLWWRLYRRLLPLLRVVRRLSRRRAASRRE